MERQCVKEDKDSGIINDANLYATETVGDPAYPLKLFQRVITVSLETMKIVRSLPKLDIQETKKNKAAQDLLGSECSAEFLESEIYTTRCDNCELWKIIVRINFSA